MSAPQTVLTLIENFERNLDAYRSGKYNETQVRRDFIDPLFKALGWDMDNSAGYAEAYRDVIHEDAIKIGTSTKAPDYSFRVGGQRKFFLEAKKPSVNVKDDVEPAFQLRRYAWSAKLPLSIVTDFEEFAIYDCRQKPVKSDKASKARLFYCTFRDYAEKWDEIAAIFSKDAVLKGSFDKYASTSKGKRGTSEVDGAFLEEIEGWRDLLARNIALRNSAFVGAPPGRDSRAGHAPTESTGGLSQRELNFAVQQTIDRIIFLRICEDRGIEPYGRLMALQNGVNVYDRLRQIFRDADDRYNSGLFHFKREKGRAEAPDELTLNLEIDDKPLKEIFKNLYYPDCPYEFSVLGADILGSVYEQFLGKVIRLTAGNRAVVEDKPEVKKAGGVFYTPAYIVKYIVAHTVGKLLEGKTSKQAAGIAILDPACGSGSFLIGAYQKLLDWYLERYVEEGAEKHGKGKDARLRHSTAGEWRLTTSEKKRILLEHIYGVDIDAQAVEVTKLSLLLKMLEGESDQTLTSQMKLFHERVLPDLDRNIQCGNSLIGPDFYDGQLDLDDEAAQRINVFDWQAAFTQIFKTGGFDAVIGNPPYLGGREWKEEGGRRYEYFIERYEIAEYQFDIYALFWEQGIRLLRQRGLIGYITPNTWLNNQSNTKLRRFILENTCVASIADYSREKVFRNAVVLPIITILKKDRIASSEVEIFVPDDGTLVRTHCVKQQIWDRDEGKVFNIGLREHDIAIRSKIENAGKTLEEFATVKFGIKLYETGKGNPPQKSSDAKGHIFESTKKLDSTYRRYLEGKDINRYSTGWQNRWLKYGDNLAAPRDPALFGGARLLVRRIVGERLIGTLVDTDYVTSQLLQIVKPYDENLAKFLLGVLNSSLIAYYFKKKYNRTDKTFPEIRIYELASLPIYKIDLSNTTDRIAHDKLVALVEKMLTLHQQLAAAKTPQDANLLQRQIAATDKQIDQLVYLLYGLTDEEIALVEGAS